MYLFLHNKNNKFLKHNLKTVSLLRRLHRTYRFCWREMSSHNGFSINWLLFILKLPLCLLIDFFNFLHKAIIFCCVCSYLTLYNFVIAFCVIYFLYLVNSEWLLLIFGAQLVSCLFVFASVLSSLFQCLSSIWLCFVFKKASIFFEIMIILSHCSFSWLLTLSRAVSARPGPGSGLSLLGLNGHSHCCAINPTLAAGFRWIPLSSSTSVEVYVTLLYF